MIKKAIEKLVTLKQKRSFSFDPQVSNAYVIRMLLAYGKMYISGALKLKRGVFIGTKTVVLNKNQIACSGTVKIGRFCLLDALSKEGVQFVGNFSLGDYSVIKCSGSLRDLGKGIKFGNNVGIGEFAYIGGAGGVEIGSDTIVGQYLSIHPENHVFSDSNKIIREQGVTRKGVCIGRNCWIGSKVTFLDGSKVGDGCVVAAGAVVNGIFPDNAVIGGVPAKILKFRS